MPHLPVHPPHSAQLQNSRFGSRRHFGSFASLSPSDAVASPYSTPEGNAGLPSIEPDLILTSRLGHGAIGSVFLGLAEDGSQYAVKVATSKQGKEMLSKEAFIYDRLSELQGE